MMNRRNFIKTMNQFLLALAGSGIGRATAGMSSEAASPSLTGHSITLFLAGDVMTGRGIDQVLPHPVDPTIHESYMKSAKGYVEIAEELNGRIPRPVSFDYIWGDALGILNTMAPDLRIINLETSITTSDDFWPHKGIHYRMHPYNTPAVSTAGIDCCVLANNHVLDWGYQGLEETLVNLHRAGLQTAGAGRYVEEASAPAVFDLGGIGRVLVFSVASVSSGVPAAWAATHKRAGVHLITDFSPGTVERIADQVRAYKRLNDIALLSIHWGGNWGYPVPSRHRRFAHRLIDQAGIDVIHGHSSHHPMGIEVYRGKPIIYGCGDLINDYEGIGGREKYRPDLSLLYFVSIDTRSGELASLQMIPMRIQRFQLSRAPSEAANWLAATMDRECRRLNCRVKLQGDRGLRLGW